MEHLAFTKVLPISAYRILLQRKSQATKHSDGVCDGQPVTPSQRGCPEGLFVSRDAVEKAFGSHQQLTATGSRGRAEGAGVTRKGGVVGHQRELISGLQNVAFAITRELENVVTNGDRR